MPVRFLYTVGTVQGGSLEPRRRTGQQTPFDFRMFKIITRAKAIPAKRQLFKTRTRVNTVRGHALGRGATKTDNMFLFF